VRTTGQDPAPAFPVGLDARMAMASTQGEECPLRLVHESENEPDGSPKQCSSRCAVPSVQGDGYSGRPSRTQCNVSWNVGVWAHHTKTNWSAAKWHQKRAIELIKAIYKIDQGLGFGWRLYLVMGHALERMPRAFCHKECRGLPQPLPHFPPNAADGAFVDGAWYYHQRKTTDNFVVVQVISTRLGRTGKRVLSVRALMDVATPFGRQVRLNAARAVGNPDKVAAEWVNSVLSNKPLELARPSFPFEVNVKQGHLACKCCGSMRSHDAIVVGGAHICAWNRVQRGGIAI